MKKPKKLKTPLEKMLNRHKNVLAKLIESERFASEAHAAARERTAAQRELVATLKRAAEAVAAPETAP